MARPVRMPPLGETSGELRIVQWLKEVGAAVEQGELLLEVETDKATLEVEAAVSGTLLAVLHGPGETVAVGEVLAFVGSPGEEVPAVEPSEPRPAAKKQAVPVARKLAQEHGIDLASVHGSGPGGRIEKQDVLALIDAAPVPEGEMRAVAAPARRGGAPDAVGADDPPVQRGRRRRHEQRSLAARAGAHGRPGRPHLHAPAAAGDGRRAARAPRAEPAVGGRRAAPAPARAGRRRPRRGRRGHAARARRSPSRTSSISPRSSS